MKLKADEEAVESGQAAWEIRREEAAFPEEDGRHTKRRFGKTSVRIRREPHYLSSSVAFPFFSIRQRSNTQDNVEDFSPDGAERDGLKLKWLRRNDLKIQRVCKAPGFTLEALETA